MNYSIFKLEFLTPVHFGASDSARSLESAGMSLCADTVFSALCHAALRSDGFDLLIEAVKNDELLISDAMPYCGNDFYVPKPALPASKHSDSDPSIRKLMKKLSFIPLSTLCLFLTSLRGEGDFDPSVVKSRFGEYFANEKVAIDYTDDNENGGKKASDPYSVGAFQFDDDCGLYFVTAYDSENSVEIISRLLRLLGTEGIGGKISAGYGKFRIADTILLDGSEPENLKSFRAMLEDESASRYILLTSSLPKDDELEKVAKDARFTMIRRAGFVQSEGIKQPIKKRTQFFFAPGSAFEQKYKGDLYDVGEKMPHPVYRYSKPLFLGVNV